MAKNNHEERNELRGMIYSVYPNLSVCAEDIGCGLSSLLRYVHDGIPIPLPRAVRLARRVGISLDEFVRRAYPELASEETHDAR